MMKHSTPTGKKYSIAVRLTGFWNMVICKDFKLKQPAEEDGTNEYPHDGIVGVDASRRIVIEANVVGRDLVGAVKEAQARVAREVLLPTGYYLTWGGQFEIEQQAMRRLAIAVPLVIGLIFLLLFFTFGNLRQAALILLAIPFAMVGACWPCGSAGCICQSLPPSALLLSLAWPSSMGW